MTEDALHKIREKKKDTGQEKTLVIYAMLIGMDPE